MLQLQKKKDRDEAKAEKARERAYWVEVAACGWRNELQACMKSSLPPPPGASTSVYIGSVPAWCIANQRRRKMVLDLKRGNSSRPRSNVHRAGEGDCPHTESQTCEYAHGTAHVIHARRARSPTSP
jgi:hypothetical protein